MRPSAVTSMLDPFAVPTLTQLFDNALERFGERSAITYQGRCWSYREIAQQAQRLAGALSKAGIGPGGRVALMMSNRPEYLVADLAIIRCGGVKVPLNDMLSTAEIEFILRDSGVTIAVADPGLLPAALASDATALHTIVAVALEGDRPARAVDWDDFLYSAPDHLAPDAVPIQGPAPEDLGLILYTGGTTGRPKGVTHTQRGLAMNLLSHIVEMGLGDEERILLMSPLPHSAGFLAQAGLLRGATILLERRFDPDRALDLIGAGAVTFTFMVPTMIYRLLDRTPGRNLQASVLRTILYGAAPITLERLQQGLQIFGSVFMQLYGQSEAPNFLTRLRREDHALDPALAHRLTSCGQPVLLADVAVLDENDEPLPAGQLGEIAARSPYVMAGYLAMPGKTAETLRGGWLHTGDIGYMDADRYVYLIDRKNDVIITGGMNVYSSEVEQFLQTCAGVLQAAVVGIPDPDWGEAVVAFVVTTDPHGAQVSDDHLSDRCRSGLAAYKRPKSIRRVAELPLTPYGKVDKKLLRTQFLN
jgi:fatty-acyl-CoA synthase